MNIYSRTALALAAIVLAGGASSGADRRQSFDELTRAADRVVMGTVGAKSSRWSDDAHIYTDVLIQPDVTIKGADEGDVVVEVLGGTVGDTVMTVSDGPEFPDGERVVLFLKRDRGRFAQVRHGILDFDFFGASRRNK